MTKVHKLERVRSFSPRLARLAGGLIRLDRSMEAYLERKAAEIEAFNEQLDVQLTPEPTPAAN